MRTSNWATTVIVEIAIVAMRAGLREPPALEMPRNFWLALVAELRPVLPPLSAPVLQLPCPRQYDFAPMMSSGPVPSYIGPREVRIDRQLVLDGVRVPVPGGVVTVRPFFDDQNALLTSINIHGTKY